MTLEFTPPRAAVLNHLRHVQSARFRDLMHAANMESDVFKFHVRYLAEQGIISKQSNGSYSLTLAGKEIANNLNEQARNQLKQPKLSLLLVISRQNAAGATEYLFQKRLRQPFYGYWGLLSGPAQWGENFAATAAHELHKQTGIAATVAVRTFLRQTDYTANNELLEDKLFVVTGNVLKDGSTPHAWRHGENAWMTLAQLTEQAQYFTLTLQSIQAYESATYIELRQVIDPASY